MDPFDNPWTFKVLRCNYNEPISYYFTSAIFLLLVTVLSTVYLSGKRSLQVPVFGQDDNDKSAQQKRWMADCLGLLQEGYRKAGYFPYYS
jgi:hypothetical protein